MSIRVSANKIAEFATAKTPARRKAIVRSVKYAKPGHAPWYMAFGSPAKEFLLSGAKDPTPVLNAVEAMKTRTDTPWRKMDSRITADLFKAFLSAAPELDALGSIKFAKTPKSLKPKLQFGEVQITLTPDLLIHGERKGVPLLGALRFYLAKESRYQLGERAAQLVSAMMYRWLTETATGAQAPDTSLCAVLECFQGRVTTAKPDIEAEYAVMTKACTDFTILWDLLDEKDAA